MSDPQAGPTPEAPYFERAELRFECQRSGNCCKRPGYVFFTPDDVTRVARHLGIGRGDFARGYLRLEAGQWFLEVDPGPCRFYDGAGCTIHAVKPLQCRTWPVWPELVESERGWAEAGLGCPGIGRGERLARVTVRDTVERLRAARIPEAKGMGLDPLEEPA